MKSSSQNTPKPISPKTFAAALVGALAALSACATSPRTADSGPNQPAASTVADSTPAAQLAREVNAWHDSALVSKDTAFLFDEAKVHEFAREVIARACPKEMRTGETTVSPECNRLFGAAVASVLHERYFAAEAESIQSHCRAEPLTCEDARTFEVLFREEHNAGIERSRADKLQKIEQWKAGQMTNLALEQALHIHFELQNGELITHFPPPATKGDRAPAGS